MVNYLIRVSTKRHNNEFHCITLLCNTFGTIALEELFSTEKRTVRTFCGPKFNGKIRVLITLVTLIVCHKIYDVLLNRNR
jgi:hypothetical protein